MSINLTTLASAMLLTDTTVTLTSGTGVSAPNYQVGDPTRGVASTVTYLLIEQELIKISGPALGGGSTVWPCVRGEYGTVAAAHASSCPVVIGLPLDFAGFIPPEHVIPSLPLPFQGFSAPVASAATIAASGPFFHVTGTTAINIITPPAGMLQGELTVVFDSVCTWTSSNTTNGISASGTPTTAGSAVTFYLDAVTQRWYPSRLA